MADSSNAAPVVIKRKKVVAGDGHHGGAWKVAYADFVTAMMAFFMLMWLLNATTEKQRKGLADYFAPTVAIVRVSGGGNGALSGEGLMAETRRVQIGQGASNAFPTAAHEAMGASGLDPEGKPDSGTTRGIEELQARLSGLGGESHEIENLYEHIVTRMTDEGLVIELHDRELGALFDRNNRPTQILRQLVVFLADQAQDTQSEIALAAHVASNPVVMAHSDLWRASMTRAVAFRALLEQAGLPAYRVMRLTGHGARKPADANPLSARNNRLEIIFLR